MGKHSLHDQPDRMTRLSFERLDGFRTLLGFDEIEKCNECGIILLETHGLDMNSTARLNAVANLTTFAAFQMLAYLSVKHGIGRRLRPAEYRLRCTKCGNRFYKLIVFAKRPW